MGERVRRYTIEIKDPEGRTVLFFEAELTRGDLRSVIEETLQLAGLPKDAGSRAPAKGRKKSSDGGPRR